MKLLELTQLKGKDDCLKLVLFPMLMDGRNTINIIRTSSTQISTIFRTSSTTLKSGIKDSKMQTITKMWVHNPLGSKSSLRQKSKKNFVNIENVSSNSAKTLKTIENSQLSKLALMAIACLVLSPL